jgi:hypothetical protein
LKFSLCIILNRNFVSINRFAESKAALPIEAQRDKICTWVSGGLLAAGGQDT